MVAFTGRCLTHRAEIMWLHGAWPEALEEARRAGRRCARGQQRARGRRGRLPCRASVHRLRGELAAAEDGLPGREPARSRAAARPRAAAAGPGRRPSAAAAAIRRALGETAERPQRARLLPAYVEIMLARRRRRGGARRLRRARADRGRPRQRHAAGDGRARARGGRARRRRRRAPPWFLCGAPRGCGSSSRRRTRRPARVRSSALACRALGDDDAAAFELEAARGVFAALGAAPDLARRGSLMRPAATADAHGLTRARAGGAPPRRGGEEQPRRSPPSWSSASTRSPATCRTSSPSSASRRAPPRARRLRARPRLTRRGQK